MKYTSIYNRYLQIQDGGSLQSNFLRKSLVHDVTQENRAKACLDHPDFYEDDK